MTTPVLAPFSPLAGVLPRRPVVSLQASAVAPANEPNEFELDADQLSSLPEDLAAELREIAAVDGGRPVWTRGFAYLPEMSTEAVSRSQYDNTTVDDPFTPANESLVTVIPFLIEHKFTCSPFQFEELDWIGRATRANEIATPKAIGKEFWGGAISTAEGYENNFLTNIANAAQNLTPGSTTIINGTPCSMTRGLQLLQQALADTGAGAQGMIHGEVQVIPNLLEVRRQGKFMLDNFDNFIIPDPGYLGTGPGGSEPSDGCSWMYATDLVAVRVEPQCRVIPDTMAEALDRGEGGNPNTVTYRSFRFACAYFDGLRQFAVQVELSS